MFEVIVICDEDEVAMEEVVPPFADGLEDCSHLLVYVDAQQH